MQDRASKILGSGGLGAVVTDVTGTVDPSTGLLTITATDSDPARAQAVAKAYSQAFVDQTQALVQQQIDKYNAELSTLSGEIAALEASSMPATAVTNAQIAGLTSTYTSVQTQLNNVEFGEPYATIQVTAGYPSSPTGLSKSKLLGIGLVAGILVGCGIALARDQLDTRLRTSPEVESITDSPILAELPQDRDVRAGTVGLALVQAPQSGIAESIRELRTSLRVILDDTPSPVIVVTSPEAGDGKTFVAANLAAAWAMSGSKVIVVSADFRRPRVEELFGLQTNGRPGLADLIRSNWRNPELDARPTIARNGAREGESVANRAGDRVLVGASHQPSRAKRDAGDEADLAAASGLLLESGIWGLKVLPAGTHLENPAELFGSPGMPSVLNQLSRLADIVLIDTPPVLVVPDTAIIGSQAHGAVLVAAEGKTARADLERAVRRLETTHCRVLGVALNRVRRSVADSYKSYAYKQ